MVSQEASLCSSFEHVFTSQLRFQPGVGLVYGPQTLQSTAALAVPTSHSVLSACRDLTLPGSSGPPAGCRVYQPWRDSWAKSQHRWEKRLYRCKVYDVASPKAPGESVCVQTVGGYLNTSTYVWAMNCDGTCPGWRSTPALHRPEALCMQELHYHVWYM